MAFLFLNQPAFSQILYYTEEVSTNPISIIVENIVHFYQTNIGKHSVSRCPFTISCSNFLLRAIKKEGAIKGTALFIDRYYYRENQFLYSKYKLIINEKYLYDDSINEKYLNYLYHS